MDAMTYRRRSPAERAAGIAIVVLLHLGALWGLLQVESVRRSIAEAAPIMVDFILPPKVVPPPPKIERRPVAPRTQTKPAAPPPPVVTTNAIDSPAPPVVAEPPRLLPPIAAPAERPAQAAPAPVVPPRFDAAYLRNPPPAYPALSRRYREQGKVLLRVYVSAAGTAEKVELETSSGFPRLDEAAQQAVRAWRFVPAAQGERPIAGWVNVPLRFSLEGPAS